MVWNEFFILLLSVWLVSPVGGYNDLQRVPVISGYFVPPESQKKTSQYYVQTPLQTMVEITNNLGVTILKDNSFSRGNYVFSPYGVASVLVVLYEGARGESARQISRAVGFPSNRSILRMGFSDLHRHLQDYFSHEGFLSGISLNKDNSNLTPEYKKVLELYGYDVDRNQTQFQGHWNAEEANTTDSSVELLFGSTESVVNNHSQEVLTEVAKDVEKTTKIIQNVETTTNPVAKLIQNDKENTEIAKEKESTTKAINTNDTTTEAAQNKDTETVKDKGTTTETVKDKETAETVKDKEPTTGTVRDKKTTTATAKDTETTTETVKGTETTTETVKGTETTTETDKDTETTTETAKDTETTTETAKDTETTTESAKDTETTTESAKDTETTTETTQYNQTTTEILQYQETKAETTLLDETTTQVSAEAITIKTSNAEATMKDKASSEEMQNEKGKSKDVKNKTTFTTISINDKAILTDTVKQEPVKEVKNKRTTPAVSIQSETNAADTEKDEAEETKMVKEKTTERQNEAEITVRDTEESSKGKGSKRMKQLFDYLKEKNVKAATTGHLDNGMLIPQKYDFLAGKSKPTQERKSFSEPMTWLEASNAIDLSNITREETKFTGQQRHRTLQNMKNIKNIVNVRIPLWLDETLRKAKPRRRRTLLRRDGTHTTKDPHLSWGLPKLPFLVDGTVDVPVPMMIFSNVFPYAYIPWLQAKALVFPLDDVRYKLLILSPVERRGLSQLIHDLAEFQLSNVLRFLRPSMVRAMVPTFRIEGSVVFTPSLKKLGILDVFDPHKANLSGMTTDSGLYVRNVEQSVTVVIKNYVEILDVQTRTMASRHLEYKFEATHPFLYFILDSSTNVALMAGQMLNPLYTRLF